MATFFTIGHSNRSSEELIELLTDSRIERLVDVRRFPGSRKHPQFGREPLSVALAEVDIVYEHVESLGGRRKRRDPSPNAGWRNQSFQGYADHMATPAFREALARVVSAGERLRTALMCAEAVPWRCHRQLISDVLVVHGHDVRHIIGSGSPRPHSLTGHARPQPDGTVIYPPQEA